MTTKATSQQNNKPIKKGNPVVNGLRFLGKSVYSQWKVLLSITVIFLLITFVLSSATFALDHLTKGQHFMGEGVGTHLTFGESFWWVFVTISTVGYGDIVPITAGMRAWAVFISIIGISFLALYTAVVVNGFTQEFQKRANPEQFEEVLTNEELESEMSKLTKENEKLKRKLESLEEQLELD